MLPTQWEKILANQIANKGLIFRIFMKVLKLSNNNLNKMVRFFGELSPKKICKCTISP
jgi:hypothetical protein